MPRLEVTGSYMGLQTLRTALGVASTDTTRDATLLRHLLAASRAIERDTLRRFFPVTAVSLYRWPPSTPQATWTLWLDDDLIAVSLLQVAASGQGAVPVTLTNYFLEPQQYGPPYSRIEVDLSSADVYQSGPTPQRAVAVTGQWGYTADTVAAGTVSGLSSAGATAATCSNGALVETGDVLLCQSEALYVSAGGGTTQITVQRGVNGTAAATHADGTVLTKYVAPSDIQNVVAADAVSSYEQEMISLGHELSAGDPAVMTQAMARGAFRTRIIKHYNRPRSAAI